MGWDVPSLVLLAALVCLLVSAGIEDVRCREIANWKNVAVALLAPLWWWRSGYAPWPDVPVQLLIAGIVFALFVGAFAMNWMGGGDVKLIGALALWLPLQPLLWMLIAMSIAGGVLTVGMVLERRHRRPDGPPVEVPYGVAIGLAALLTFAQPIFNQFS